MNYSWINVTCILINSFHMWQKSWFPETSANTNHNVCVFLILKMVSMLCLANESTNLAFYITTTVEIFRNSTYFMYNTYCCFIKDFVRFFSDLSVETIASFTSHVEKIASLAWSPHFNAQLISASYDSTVQVCTSYLAHYNDTKFICIFWNLEL